MAEIIDFTVRTIDALPLPASGRAEYRDRKTPGLYLRVTNAGTKSFSFIGRAKGSSLVERVTLGKYPAVKPEEAKRQAAVMNGGLAAGTSAAAAARGKRNELTLAELAKEYLKSLQVRGVDLRDVEGSWELYIKPAFGNRRLSEIRATDIERWHRGIPAQIQQRRQEVAAARAKAKAEKRARIVEAQAGRRRGPEPKPAPPRTSAMVITGHHSANRALQLLSSMYRWAMEAKHGYFTGANPAAGHDQFPTTSRKRFLRPHELRPFFQSLANVSSETMRDFILVALLTGGRRSNVTAMRWAHVDLELGEWTVAGEEMKNEQPQTFTLTPEAVEILKRRKEGATSPWVFPSEKAASGHIEDPRRTWERVLRQSGLTNLRLHDLRRTLGSWQARTGASLLLIGKSLNHLDPSSTAIYAHLDLDPVRHSVERATSAMFEAAGVKQSAEVVPISSARPPAKSGTGKTASKSAKR
jgi:integrase